MAKIFFPLYNPGSGGGAIGENGIYDLKKSFGARGDGSYDNTQAFQDAINAIAANMTANNGAAGAILLDGNGYQKYLVNGPLQLGANSQIVLPDVGFLPGNGKTGYGLSIRIFSHTMPSFSDGGYLPGVRKQRQGAVIQSGINGSGELPAIFGALGSYVNGLTNVDFLMENLTLRNLSNNGSGGVGPTLSGINASNLATARFKSVVVDVDAYGYDTVLPQANTYGIIGVETGSDTFNTWHDVLALGYRTGFRMGEHSTGDQIQAFCCLNGIEFAEANHDSFLNRVCLQWVKNGLVASGPHRVRIASYDVENIARGKWYDNAINTGAFHVLDPNNYLKGGCYYNVTTSEVGPDNKNFFKSGGAGFACIDSEKFGTGALDGTGSTIINYRIIVNPAPASGAPTAVIPGGADVVYANQRDDNARTGFRLNGGNWQDENSPSYVNGVGAHAHGGGSSTPDDETRVSYVIVPRRRYAHFYFPTGTPSPVVSVRVGPTLVDPSLDLAAPEGRNAYNVFVIDLGVNFQQVIDAGYGIKVANASGNDKFLLLPAVVFTDSI